MADDDQNPMMSTMVIKPGSRPKGFEYKTLNEFFPYYMSEHSNRTCRRLHFVGTTLALVLFATAIITQMWWLIAVGFVQGYAFAWVGHFAFEHNKPATFKYPWLSFKGDWRMWWQMLTGKIPF